MSVSKNKHGWVLPLVLTALVFASLACSVGQGNINDEEEVDEPDSEDTGGMSREETVALVVVNDTDTTICYVQISPSTADSWGEDWLAEDEVLSAGDEREFSLEAGEWDMRVLDCEQNELDSQMGITIDDDTEWVVSGNYMATTGEIPVTLVNNSGETVCYVMISPVTSDSWGDDWLGSDVIPDGTSYTFYVESGDWDMLALDCDQNEMATEMGVEVYDDVEWTLSSSAGSPYGAGEVEVMLINNSGETVCYVMISPVTSDTWGDDWLGSDVIPDGTSYTFYVEVGDWDMLALDCDQNELATEMGVEITGNSEWTLSTGDSSGGSSSGGDESLLTLVNNSGETVCYVMISPVTSDTWGDDWLGSDVIPNGTSYTFSVSNGDWDMLALDCDQNEMATEMGVGIYNDTEWTLSTSDSGGSSSSGGESWLNLVNNSGETVCYVFISPVTSDTWGNDWLGADVIPNGTSYSFSVSHGDWDLMAMDCDQNEMAIEMGVGIYNDVEWTLSIGG